MRMTSGEIERIAYRGELWLVRGAVPHPALARLLTAQDHLIVLYHDQPPLRVVLGVPHQAAMGEKRICENRIGASGNLSPRDSDENAASYALVAFAALRERGIPCKLVIMAHATTHDPNKEPYSPYCQEIFADRTAFLLECHGAAEWRSLPLELSAGGNRLSDAMRFSRALRVGFDCRYRLGIQRWAGTNNALILNPDGTQEEGVLELPATRTASLIEAQRRNIPALHLEARSDFLEPPDGSDTVTPDGLILGRALASAIADYSSRGGS